MAKVIVEFRVQINQLLQKNEKVFMTGSIPEFGNWYPMKSRMLKRLERSTSNNNEIWGTELSLQLCEIQYRYFIGTTDENESYDEKSINIHTWESHIEPRMTSVLNRVCNISSASVDVYGQIDEHSHISRGWLTDQTAVQIRLFDEAIKLYPSRFKSQRLFVKCHHFQMNRNYDNPDDDRHSIVHNVAKVSKLTDRDCVPHAPPHQGTEYSQDQLTFHVETMDLEDMGIDIEIRQLLSDSSSAIDKQDEFVVVGVARLGVIPSKRGVKLISIYNELNRPIGEIKVDFLAVFPLMGHWYTMEKTFQMHWKHRKTLKVGHKGSGTSYGHTTKMSAVRENTIYSLKNAFQHGADFVEFDVQLSKDLIPVLYHDFKVCTVLRKKKKNELQFLAVPVKDLVLSDLQALKLDHTSAMTDQNSDEIMNMDEADPAELQPFPTLEACLDEVDCSMGFNIELKYPQELMNGEHEQTDFFDRNLFVDKILNVVAKHAAGRRIIFSCFDADVCLMLSLKQNRYPVMFLTQGDTIEYDPYKDPRTRSLAWSLYFAKSCNVLGLCAFSSNVADNLDLLQTILDMKLVVFLWGESNNDVDSQDLWVARGVHGIIFDRIHEFQALGSLNVFLVDGSSPPGPLSALSAPVIAQCS